jgi:hypothetical protein
MRDGNTASVQGRWRHRLGPSSSGAALQHGDDGVPAVGRPPWLLHGGNLGCCRGGIRWQVLPPRVFYPFFLCTFCVLHETCIIRLLLVFSSI